MQGRSRFTIDSAAGGSALEGDERRNRCDVGHATALDKRTRVTYRLPHIMTRSTVARLASFTIVTTVAAFAVAVVLQQTPNGKDSPDRFEDSPRGGRETPQGARRGDEDRGERRGANTGPGDGSGSGKGGGQRQRRSAERLDVEDGPHVTFHPNGQRKLEGAYLDGFREGVWTFWDDTGRKLSETTFKGGKRDGTSIRFFPDGSKGSLATYRDGKRHDLVIEWYTNGQKKTEIEFRNGRKNGRETRWLKDGKIWYQATWRDGERVSEDMALSKDPEFRPAEPTADDD